MHVSELEGLASKRARVIAHSPGHGHQITRNDLRQFDPGVGALPLLARKPTNLRAKRGTSACSAIAVPRNRRQRLATPSTPDSCRKGSADDRSPRSLDICRLRPIFEEVAGLALQNLADIFECLEAHALD